MRKRTLVTVLTLLGPCAALARTPGARAARPARVLVIYQQQAETGPMREFADGLRKTLETRLSSVEIYQEALDFDRFGGREASSPLVHYFEDKYRGYPIDAVVPVGSRALRFAIDHLTRVLPETPIAFALCGAPGVDPSTLPRNVTGRLAADARFAPTLAMARALQPDAESIVLVGGAGGSDSGAVMAALSAVRSSRDPLPVRLLVGLSLDELLRRIHRVPRRSIVIFANFRRDGRGQTFDPIDIIGSIARASSSPMYTQLRSYIGEGVVGGFVTSFDEEGKETARLVARVLGRRSGEAMPPVETISNSFVADWRQLQRWDLSEERLPPGTRVLFREAGLWTRNRGAVLLSIGFVTAESILVGLLLVERRQRVRAQRIAAERQREMEQARRQVAHMGRVALVGEMAATISHELRQPLAAIRANAEAGALLAARPPLDGSEAREIFENIVADDVRAVEVIESVRKLLRKDEPTVTTVDLNRICDDAVRLLEHDAKLRATRLELSCAPTASLITGDAVQLSQVALNLMLNALDAASASPSERFVAVRTESHSDHVDLVVRDSGPGIPPSAQAHLFEAFYSTKKTGLGLGLVIVRSIVQRHGGTVSAENDLLGGAAFRVRLPKGAGYLGAPSLRGAERCELSVAGRSGAEPLLD